MPHPPPFGLIISITLTGIMANTLATPAIPDIIADLGAGPAGAGVLLAATTGPGILLAPVIGVLADRFGRRELLVPCLVVFGFAGGMASFAPNFGALVVLRLLQGVGAAGLLNLAVVLIGDHWDGVDRARRIGQNAAALTASIAVLPPLGGVLAAVGGWRLSFAPYWLAAITAVAVLRTLPRSVRGGGSLADQLRSAGPYLRSGPVVGATAAAFVIFVVVFGVFLTVLPVHLAREFGAGPALRGVFLAAPALTSTLTALNIGRLQNRFGTRVVMVGGSVFLTAGMLQLAAAGSLPTLAIAPIVYGFGEGALIPILQDTVAGAAPASSRGSVVAVFVGVTRAGQTTGPLLGGAGLEVTSARTLFLAGAALGAALGVVTAGIARFAKKSVPSAQPGRASGEFLA